MGNKLKDLFNGKITDDEWNIFCKVEKYYRLMDIDDDLRVRGYKNGVDDIDDETLSNILTLYEKLMDDNDMWADSLSFAVEQFISE